MEFSAGGHCVSSIPCSSLVSATEPENRPPSLWKEYTKFLQKPIIVVVVWWVVWPVVVGYFVNHIFSWATQSLPKSTGVIPFLPYMAFSALLFVITVIWWCFKHKEHRQRLQEYSLRLKSRGTQMTQASQSFTIPVSDDAIERRSPINLPVESGGDGCQYEFNNSRITGDNTNDQSARSSVNQDLQGDPSILSPQSDRQNSEEADQNQVAERIGRHCPAERNSGRGREVMNGDSRTRDCSNNDLSTGSSLNGDSDPALASLPPNAMMESNSGAGNGPQLLSPGSPMLTIANIGDIARLVEPLIEALQNQPGPCVCLVAIVNSNDISGLLERFQPDANLPGSRVLHKRIEIGRQTGNGTGNWWKNFLCTEIIEYMRMAKTYDNDCTMQLGSVAILKDTDAGLKCWMLQEDWTPVILDLRRSPQTFLDLLNDERPKWTVRGFNLEKATLRVATTERSKKLTILGHSKIIDNGVEELLFEEPHTFPMFSKQVYISASNTVQVEGVAFNLHSEARKVRRAFWISVLDGLIPILWTGILIESLLLVRGFVVPTQQEFFVANWLTISYAIGISIYFLGLHGFAPLQDLHVHPNHPSTIVLEDDTSIPATPSTIVLEDDTSIPATPSTIVLEDDNSIPTTPSPEMRKPASIEQPEEDVPLLDSPPIPLGSQSIPLFATLGWTREGKLNVTRWAEMGGTERKLFAEVYFSLGCKGGAGGPTVKLAVKQVEFGVTNSCTRNCSSKNLPCHPKCKTAFIYKLTIEVRPKSWAKRDCHLLELEPYHTPAAVVGLERNSSYSVHIPVRVKQAALTYKMGAIFSQTAPSFGWSPAWTDGHTVSWKWELWRFADGTEVQLNKFRWGSRPVPITPDHFQLHPESFQPTVKWEFAAPVDDLLSRLEREGLEFDVKITLDTAVSESKRRFGGFKVTRGPTVTFDTVMEVSSKGIIFRT